MGISNAQYMDIMYQYDQIRLKNHHLSEKRYTEVCEKIPEIQQIQEELVKLSADYARLQLLGTDGAIQPPTDYFNKKKELQEKKAQLLTRNGYPADYLAPVYNCKSCKDTGYIGSTPCSCLKQHKTAMLYKNSNLMEILESENFNTFSENYYNDTEVNENLSLTPRQNIIKIKEICLDYTRHFDEIYKNIIFYGPTGVGKTFMTHCIAKALLDTSHTVIYLTALQLFDILEKNKFGKNNIPEYSGQVSYILESELLIIDDLGTELANSFTSSQLYYLIEERHLKRKAVIISTNLPFKELRDRYSERIFSRFTGYYNFYMIAGDDIRIKIALS
ncbi:MAG: ATP-binding protein [Lachnospiraceae bacterium]